MQKGVVLAIMALVGTLCGSLIIFIITSWPFTPTISVGPFDVYFINLDRAKARVDIFKEEYDKSDLAETHSLIRFSAVDGKTVDIASVVSPKALGEILQAERLGFRSKHYELTRGAVGCWLSHVNLWKSLLNSDKEVALVFEDDAIIPADIGKRIAELQVPEDWDYLLLGYACKKCLRRPLGDTMRVRRFFGTHAYLINTRAIKKFLASPYSKEITKQIDSTISDMANDGTWNVYAVKTKLAWQNDMFATSIQMPLVELEDIDPWE